MKRSLSTPPYNKLLTKIVSLPAFTYSSLSLSSLLFWPSTKAFSSSSNLILSSLDILYSSLYFSDLFYGTIKVCIPTKRVTPTLYIDIVCEQIPLQGVGAADCPFLCTSCDFGSVEVYLPVLNIFIANCRWSFSACILVSLEKRGYWAMVNTSVRCNMYCSII